MDSANKSTARQWLQHAIFESKTSVNNHFFKYFSEVNLQNSTSAHPGCLRPPFTVQKLFSYMFIKACNMLGIILDYHKSRHGL